MAYGTPVLGSCKSRGGNNNQERRKKANDKVKQETIGCEMKSSVLCLRMHGFV